VFIVATNFSSWGGDVYGTETGEHSEIFIRWGRGWDRGR